MLEIKRDKNYHGYDFFHIITDEGTFEISFQNNLDLYWRYAYKGNINNEPNTKIFFITKENYLIYKLFEDLYNNIKNSNPYSDYIKEQEINITDNTYPNSLYKDGLITWCSDDFSSIEKASSFSIEKIEDKYKITFKKSEQQKECGMYFKVYSVRIRNSGSRYTPYEIAFMKMYQDLKEYDPSYHQIHIEEYLYEQKKLSKIKKGIN